jgi:solute:Na+ symporter, SSS family
MNEPHATMAAADYTLILGFFAVMLGVGCYFAKRMRNTKDFFAAGQTVPWWLSSVSLWMTSFSAFAFVANSSLAYRFGFLPITSWWLGSLTAIVAGHMVAARWRRVASTSPMEFVEARYGRVMRQGLSWVGTLLIMLDDATKILAVGYIVSGSLGFPMKTAIVSCGAIILCYTFLGGLWAVIVTDFVQFVVMLTTVIVLIPTALARVGGWQHFLHDQPAGTFALTADKYTWLYLCLLALIQLLSYCTRWSLVQRFYAVPTDRDAYKVCYLVAGLSAVFAPMLVLPAMAARIFLPGVDNPDQVYGLLCSHLLPVGMLGMLVAGIMSSTMSALSGDYNAMAAVLTTDVYRRVFVRRGSERHYLLAGRIFTLVVGTAAMGIALGLAALGEKVTLFDLMVLIFSIFLPAMAIPVIAGLTSRRVSNAGAIAGVFVGLAVSGATAFWDPYLLAHPVDFILRLCGGPAVADLISRENMLMITSLISTPVGMIVGTLLVPGTPKCRAEVSRFLDGLTAKEQPSDSTATPAERAFSPVPVVGTAIAAIGALLLIVVLLSAPLAQGAWSIGVGTAMCVLGGIMIVVPKLTAQGVPEVRTPESE